MVTSLFSVFRSEWLKRKRSFASPLVVGGSLFTPAVVAAVRLLHRKGLPALYASDTFWPNMWRACWESMSVFFLPMLAILATSLIAQIEFRSNAWKQVHALPVSTAVVFAMKLAVIVLMLAQCLALFSAGIYVSGMIPSWLLPDVPHPAGSFFALPLWRENCRYFVNALPIVAIQYAVALRSANVLMPIGVGFMAWVGALAAVSSKYAICWPYAYTIIQYIRDKPKGAHFAAYDNLHWLSAVMFIAFTIAGYFVFITNREKG
ncbi:MAG TPA: ABC transporter permease [Thermoanaerobaculia bacterium]|nr:ABC transporter permease [Thermoanaerobaculia bacterium]